MLVEISEEQLLKLDGLVESELQKFIDIVKEQKSLADNYKLSIKQAGFINDVLEFAKEVGCLSFRRVRVYLCSICGKEDKRGIDLDSSFIVIKGLPKFGICSSCYDEIKEILKQELAKIPVELPDELFIEGNHRWKRYYNIECSNCGWQGHQGQLLFANAEFKKCPNCSIETSTFSNKMRFLGGFTVV